MAKKDKGPTQDKPPKEMTRKAKDATPKDVKKLRATVEKLEAKLDKADKKAEKWKSEVRAERSRSARLDARLRRLQKDRPVDHEASSPPGDVPVEPALPVEGPDESWTVSRLRPLAREQGVVGASRMTKDQLLRSLSS